MSTLARTLTNEHQSSSGIRFAERGRHRAVVVAVVLILGCGSLVVLLATRPQSTTPVDTAKIVNTYPHDNGAFTQGLAISNGQLYEGTGQYGTSTLRHVELETGKVLRSVGLQRQFFGEGIAIWKDSIIQLTWKSRRAFVFDLATLKYRKAYKYAGEGWGLTHDGRHLIISDGSSRLRFVEPDTFREVRRVTVHDGRRRIEDLNELEYVDGEIYANVWYNDAIARISPEDGRVLGWIDLSHLWPVNQRPTREHVLNGIAYDATNKRLFVTGKNWPRLFEIRVVPAVR